jgi:hypothetical protein
VPQGLEHGSPTRERTSENEPFDSLTLRVKRAASPSGLPTEPEIAASLPVIVPALFVREGLVRRIPAVCSSATTGAGSSGSWGDWATAAPGRAAAAEMSATVMSRLGARPARGTC